VIGVRGKASGRTNRDAGRGGQTLRRENEPEEGVKKDKKEGLRAAKKG